MKLATRLALVGAILAQVMLLPTAQGQTAIANPKVTCIQTGVTVECKQDPVVFTLPVNVTLTAQTSGTGFTLFAGTTTPTAPGSCRVTPANQTVALNSAPTLSATCDTGSGGYTYEWTKAGILIQGETGPSYQLKPAIDTNAPGVTSYGVKVTNAQGFAQASTNVTVTAAAAVPPTGCSISASATTTPTGTTPTLTVINCSGTAPFNYQWKKAGIDIGGATGASYQLSATADTATVSTTLYSVAVSNSAGNATPSPSVTITVTQGAVTSCPIGTLNYALSPTASRSFNTSGQYGVTPVSIAMDVASTTTTVGLNSLPQLWFSETAGSSTSLKEVTISTSPCNFSSNPEFVVIAPDEFSQSGWTFLLFNDSRPSLSPRLTTGRWYINIRNIEGACPSQCNTLISFVK